MSPSSVSPILKTNNIVFTVVGNFPFTLDNRKDFTVNITSRSAPDYMKRLNVIGVSEQDRTITAKFGGAISGEYDVHVDHTQYGRIDTSALRLYVESEYSSISPTVGSIFGGTLLTITGTNWGTEITDNPVEISYNGALGSTKCFVQTTSAS
jgi:hypothetical protein